MELNTLASSSQLQQSVSEDLAILPKQKLVNQGIDQENPTNRLLIEESKDEDENQFDFVKIDRSQTEQEPFDLDLLTSQRTYTQGLLQQDPLDSIIEERRATIPTKQRGKGKQKPFMTPQEALQLKFRHYIYSRSKQILSIKEKETVWDFLKSHGQQLLTKPMHHRYTWLKCSGAYNQMLSNPGYYKRLLKNSLDYPNPSQQQIELDLKRTYPFEKCTETLERNIIPLRNILSAYVQRCPTLGYCQGWNHIAARLLAVMQEEEAFWTLVQIIECILPLDYYSNLLGVLIDLKVFQAIMEDRLPKLCNHLAFHKFDLNLLLTKWLICLFVNHLPLDAELAVWDLFLIKGVSVLFRVALTLFTMMQEEILAVNDYGDIFMIVDKFGLKVKKEDLLRTLFVGLKVREIEFYRQTKKPEIYSTLKEQLAQTKEHILAKNPNMRLEFVSRFLLYQGLVRYYTENKEKGEAERQAHQITSQSMDLYERDLMKIFNCNSEWPVCLFDFTFKTKIPTHLAFRVAQDLTTFAHEGYFYGNSSYMQPDSDRFRPQPADNQSRNEMLIERNHHLCQCKEYPYFIHNFKVRYEARDTTLLQNKILSVFLQDDTQIFRIHEQFQKDISKPLTTDIILRAIADQERTFVMKSLEVRGQQADGTQLALDLIDVNERFVAEEEQNITTSSGQKSEEKSAAEEIRGKASVISEVEMAVRITLMGADSKSNQLVSKSYDHSPFNLANNQLYTLSRSAVTTSDENKQKQLQKTTSFFENWLPQQPIPDDVFVTQKVVNSYNIAVAGERTHEADSLGVGQNFSQQDSNSEISLELSSETGQVEQREDSQSDNEQ